MYTLSNYICPANKEVVNTKKLNIRLQSLVAIAMLSIGLVFVNKVQAQSTSDSLQYALQVTVIKSEFERSAALFQLDKYKLANPFGVDGGEVFEKAWKRYEMVYNDIPVTNRKHHFTEAFFEVAMTAAQLYRNVSAVAILTKHKEEVHPTEHVHHDKWDYNNDHSEHNHND